MLGRETVGPVSGCDHIMDTEERADLVVYTQKWASDHAAAPDEKVEGLVFCRVFLNGRELERATGVEFTLEADFVVAKVGLAATDIRVVPCDRDEWAAIGK